MTLRRWAWVGVLLTGIALYLLVLVTMVTTQNSNFVPSMILIGSVTAPATFVTFAQGRSGRWQVPAGTIAATAFFGGVVGVVAAGWLEYDALRALGTLPKAGVGLIEEAAKLLAPAAVLLLTLRRRHEPSDGLVIGVASGMGFAALETMGYAFNALIASKGNIGAVEETLFVRGLTAPAAHLAWTGLTAGALFAFAAAPTGRRMTALLLTFAGAVALHALWDSFDNMLVYAVLGAISLTWLMIQLRRYRTFEPHPHPPVAAQPTHR
ncbi:PrsW family intramembrane metalloprotease [Dactylosporangium sucinum]|uniref:Protease PrsW n=1 Tax=Dactylosporangium sucinum TaxID=1424081 RepID=A0A917X7B9_9ACTN|nr:PrsW family glutamic-type intramembrane protease [Dactylosporangium sucinum]GGM82060.1 protease PrsW [Dactylosporangium sucinum]